MSTHTNWLIALKPGFMNEWLALSQRDSYRILTNIRQLEQNPHPDGSKTKEQLKHKNHKNRRLYRMRCGNHRIIYTMNPPFVYLLALRKREKDTYDDDFFIDFPPGLNP